MSGYSIASVGIVMKIIKTLILRVGDNGLINFISIYKISIYKIERG